MRAIALLLAAAGPAVAGSNGLLDLTADGTRALVANTDTGTVSVVDLAAKRLVCELPAGDHPEGVAWVPGTALGLATVHGDDKLLFLDADQKKVVHTLAVADEPYGVVVTKDGKTAFVTHDYPGSVSVIDIPNRKVVRTIPVGKDCRGVALSHDEKTLYVTEFFTAALVSVDVASGKVTDRWVGHSQDNLARHVTLHPTRPKAYLSHIRSRVTAFDARGSIFPQLSFCDLGPADGDKKRRRSLALDTFNDVTAITNPWEAALSPDGSRIYTVYAGTDDMNVSKVLDDDYLEVQRIGRLVRVGKHPRAVRVAHDGTVVVYNTLDYELALFTPDLKKLGTVAVATPAKTAEWRRGKELFQSALHPMGSARWIACSSCHPDGLTDGRVWQNPEGNRRTPHLFGLAHTHPLHWSADRDEVQDFEYTVRGKLMRGRGLTRHELKPRVGFAPGAELEQTTAGLSADLDALAAYTNAFQPRPSPHAAGPGKLTAEAERGKALFFSAETKCATCHSGPYYTDSTLAKPYKLHDVGTGRDAREQMGTKYDTPTLLSVYRTGPYLHDGTAATLTDVLTTANKADRHGKTSHLSPAQVDELVAFLKSLPYEPLPDRTANTVPTPTAATTRRSE